MTSYRDPLANALEDLAVRRAHISAMLGELRPAHRAVLSDEERVALANAAREMEVVPSTMEEVEGIVDRLETIERVIERAKTALSVDTTTSEAHAARKTVDGIGMWLTHVVAPWKGSVEQESRRWLAHAVVGGVNVELEATIVRAVGGAIRQLRFVTESQVPRALGAIAIERQRTMQSIAKALFLASEKELGDRVLDDAYWVTGDDDTLRAVIGEEVRACLASLADRVQAFEMRDGTARLTWITPPIEDVNAVLFEAFDPDGQRTATEQLVPRATFELHRAIRAALQPIVVEAPPLELEIDVEIEQPEAQHVTDATRLALVRAALQRYVQGEPAAKAQLDALGLRDLAILDELAAAYEAPEVADLAAERAALLRRNKGATRREGASALATRFLAEDASDELRMFVMELIRDDADVGYVAELMTQLVPPDGQAFARAVADDRIYDTRSIEKGVSALVDQGRSEVAAILLGLPTPICIDASLAFASIARTSQQADALGSQIQGLETKLRREILWKLTSGSSEVRLDIVRRFFGDRDPTIRSITIGTLLHRPSEEDTPALLRALHDSDHSVRESAVRACEGAWALPAVREGALSELRATYARDPSLRDVTMRSIVSLRRSKREGCDARAEFERALARLSAKPPEGYDSTLEDVVYFGHAMMAALGTENEPLLIDSFRHPRAGEFAAQLMWRLSPAATETAIGATLDRATTPEGERIVLALLDQRMWSNPYPTLLLEDLLARAPTARIREKAKAALENAPPDYTSSYY